MRSFAPLLATTLFCLTMASPSGAAIVNVYVTSSADSGPGTLRQAILDANANDLNNNGTFIHIQLASNDPIELTSALPNVSARVITIAGDSGYRPVVDGNGSRRIFTFTNSSVFVSVRNLELQFGQNSQGGCISSHATGKLNIENVYFFACEAVGTNARGGAIFSSSGQTQISESTFISNYANGESSASGGAISIEYAGSLQVSESRFRSNHAVAINAEAGARGGAIEALGANSDIDHSEFIGNEALTPNRTSHFGGSTGGAIDAGNANLAVRRSTFISNAAGEGGGAIDFFQESPSQLNLELYNNLFMLNESLRYRGGALSAFKAVANLRNNTFWHNTAGQFGDNIEGEGGSIIAHATNNLFMAGDGHHDSCLFFTIQDADNSSAYNILPAHECGMGNGPGDVITQDAGIIGLEYPQMGTAHVRLIQDSPAVEGGNPAPVNDDDPEACTELDGPGNTRPAQGRGVAGSSPPMPATCDVGAYESPGEAPLFYSNFEDPLGGFTGPRARPDPSG